MQETRNNCFRSKKRNMVLCQAKISKHEYRKITAMYSTFLSCFPFNLLWHSCLAILAWRGTMLSFLIRNKCWEFLASNGINLQSLQSLFKTSVGGASCCIKEKFLEFSCVMQNVICYEVIDIVWNIHGKV